MKATNTERRSSQAHRLGRHLTVAPPVDLECKARNLNDLARGLRSISGQLLNVPCAACSNSRHASALTCVTLQFSVPVGNGAHFTSSGYDSVRRTVLAVTNSWTLSIARSPADSSPPSLLRFQLNYSSTSDAGTRPPSSCWPARRRCRRPKRSTEQAQFLRLRGRELDGDAVAAETAARRQPLTPQQPGTTRTATSCPKACRSAPISTRCVSARPD